MRKTWLACGYAFIALVIYLSLTPSPIPAPSVDGFKTGHIIAYSWLMLWFAQVYWGVRVRLSWAAGFIAMGVALEYAQGMTGYRTFAYSDMWDNAVGVAIGLVLASTRLGRIFPEIAKAR
jgi:hypothetical protein